MSSIGSTFPPVSFPSALSSGLATIASASQQLNQDAQQIANPDTENQTNPLLDLQQSSQQAQAGAQVIRTSNELIGTLLNIFA
jgi:small-conductance mechanosensitive channel